MKTLYLKINLQNHNREYLHLQKMLAIVVFSVLISENAYSQQNQNFDEISIVLNVPRVGTLEIPAIIENDDLYLSIKDVFDFLKIKNAVSTDFNTITGFFITPKATFIIDKARNKIVYSDQTYDMSPNEFIQTETNLYLKTYLFGQIFGLECNFDFRSLTVILTSKSELPAIRELQQELTRKNLSQLKGERKADTTINYSFTLFNVGMADWTVAAIQSNGINAARGSLSLGGTIAGGEADLNLNYSSGTRFNPKQQFFRWRYVNNNFSPLRQVTAGRIFTQSVSSIFSPVTGVQFTNAPTSYRRTFGTYRINSTTEPDWMVELYVNNVLVNYAKADASGFFTFDVPIVYGNSVIRLRFYGPWGEEITREQNVLIPYNFLPIKQFEYTVSAGIISDEDKSRFLRAQLNYGLSKRITMGTGIEYLSSVSAGKPMPFINASMRIGTAFLFSADLTENVRTKATFNYRHTSNLQIDLQYIKYVKGQTAFRFNYLEEQRASLSLPFRFKNFSGFSRLIYSHYKLPKFNFTTNEFLVSTALRKFTSNITTIATYTTSSKPLIYSTLSLTYRLPSRFRFTPQLQYDFSQPGFRLIRGEIEKEISKNNFFNLSYEKNIFNKTDLINMGLRINLSFAQTSFSAVRVNKSSTLTQSAAGSFMHDGNTNHSIARNRSSVGKCGITLTAFLDMNCNGKREPNEPTLSGLRARLNGGLIVSKSNESIIRVADLEPYAEYLIELDDNQIGNIAWQVKNKVLKIVVRPNQFRQIEVPVEVLGEASGMVYINKEKEQSGLGRIIVAFYDTSSRLVAKTLTETDGYFSYLGLPPGSYTARIDATQLNNLNMTSTPENLPFDILISKDGTVADGLKFILKSK